MTTPISGLPLTPYGNQLSSQEGNSSSPTGLSPFSGTMTLSQALAGSASRQGNSSSSTGLSPFSGTMTLSQALAGAASQQNNALNSAPLAPTQENSEENQLIGSMLKSVMDTRTFTGSVERRHVSNESQNMLRASINNGGALSNERHREQMRPVDEQLDLMTNAVSNSVKEIQEIIRDCISACNAFNKKASEVQMQLFNNLTLKGSQVSAEDLQKSDYITDKCHKQVTHLISSSDKLLDNVAKAIDVTNGRIGQAVKCIFEARREEVKLITDKLETIRQQETHDMDILFKQCEASLKEQEALFGQMKEIATIEENRKESEHNRIMKEKTSSHMEKMDEKRFELEEHKQNAGLVLDERRLDIEERAERLSMDLKREHQQLETWLKETEIKENGKTERIKAVTTACGNAAGGGSSCTIM